MSLIRRLQDTLGNWINPATEDKQDVIISKLGLGSDWYSQIVIGNIPGHTIYQKFGASLLTTTIHPITLSQTFKTPTSPVALEFLSSDARDTSDGLGVRKIILEYTDASFNNVFQEIITNGITPVQLTNNCLRLLRWYVKDSGTYATDTQGSHYGTLTIRESGGGDTWTVIPTIPFQTGQSEIGCYTIPTGYKGYVVTRNIFADTGKTADIYLFQRENIDTITAPYSSMRLIERFVGIQGGYDPKTNSPKGPFVGPCDIGFMGLVSVGTAESSVEFELLLVEDGF